AELGFQGRPERMVRLQAEQRGADHLAGTAQVTLGPESADSADIAPRVTQDLLKDAQFSFSAKGDWGPSGLAWQGRMERFQSLFEGFQLVQSRPGTVAGDLDGMNVTLALEGRASRPPEPAAVPEPEGATQEGPDARWRRYRLPLASGLLLKGRVPFSTDAPVDLNLSGSSDLTNLKAILDRVVQPAQYSLLADLHTAGNARFDLNLGGTFQQTSLDG